MINIAIRVAAAASFQRLAAQAWAEHAKDSRAGHDRRAVNLEESARATLEAVPAKDRPRVVAKHEPEVRR